MLNGISDLMGAQTDRLRCEVFQNLILSPINTGTLRHAVATVLTVYGIETAIITNIPIIIRLQQCLPFTVLKLLNLLKIFTNFVLQQCLPFTVLKLDNVMSTSCEYLKLQQCLPFTVLKQCYLVAF